jgi:uncharacterized membrane protein HdeD (DUF308 family)
MLQFIGRNWWLLVLRGICAILFGVLAFTWPGMTLRVLILLFGAYAFTNGILAFAAAVSNSTGTPWWILVLEGLVSVAAALAILLYPGITALVLLVVIATWAIVTGGIEIAAAIQLRKEMEGEIWLGLAGVASIVFGALLLARPGVGALAVAWMIGAYTVMFGVMLIALGFHVKARMTQAA